MASLTIRNIPDEVMDRLKAQASAQRRSINNEAICLLEGALNRTALMSEAALADQVKAWRGAKGDWRPELSAAEERQSVYEGRSGGRGYDL